MKKYFWSLCWCFSVATPTNMQPISFVALRIFKQLHSNLYSLSIFLITFIFGLIEVTEISFSPSKT